MDMTTMKNSTLSGIGNLIKLLPTGTVFTFQFLNPVLTNGGQCTTLNKCLTSTLITLCGLSCIFSSFTDSYEDEDGTIRYGIATPNGFWPSPDSSSNVDVSKLKLRIGDFVHAAFVMVVFAAVSLLDNNTVECLYPTFEKNEKTLMMVVPPVIGAISGTVFMVFPNTRHGIGYPSTSTSNKS
ncbi:protein DMP2 [Rutidosis leptorrhynchoides]|uniref:protein DMP2 n=1 Tax=Rutidosis leptorrhynchoides TaxID=125765 RepID=UPI003A99C250